LKQTHPLPVHHSWALYERERHFELGQIHGYDTLDWVADAAGMADQQALWRPRLGQWECDLSDNSLSWSDEVYDIFGIPRGAAVTRDDAVALYGEESRAAMEKLRAYAIKHRRGFTIDVEIKPALAARRWMRLIAAPVCDGGHIVKLQGLKFIVPGRD
jgi:PAS domain-containing protein